MILFTVLALMALLFIIGGAVAILASGAAFIVVFGDVIVCVAILYLLIKHIVKKDKK